ncbi:MAG: YHS domain-containing protein [Thermoplasmata archaeon]
MDANQGGRGLEVAVGPASREPKSPYGLGRSMKVKDPVCGMMVETTTATVRGTYAGKELYFCAETCKRTYERMHTPDSK